MSGEKYVRLGRTRFFSVLLVHAYGFGMVEFDRTNNETVAELLKGG